MNTTKLEKLENATRKTFGQKILGNISLIDDESLPLIREAIGEEEDKRGLANSPTNQIIKITVDLYKAKIAEGIAQDIVLKAVLALVADKTKVRLTERDILNNLGD